jgi:hypothetical protein
VANSILSSYCDERKIVNNTFLVIFRKRAKLLVIRAEPVMARIENTEISVSISQKFSAVIVMPTIWTS